MALLYAKNNHNWSARASSNWTLTRNGTDFQTPVDADTLDANGKTITLDENLTAAVITSSASAGVFTTALNGITVTAQVGESSGAAVSTVLTFTGASPNVLNVGGNIFGGAGSNNHGLSCATNATINVTGNQTSGLTTGHGISFTGGGTLNVTGNQTAVGTTGDGINVATAAATVTIIGNQTGGASSGDGIHWLVGGTLTITGNQTGGTASTACGITLAGAATVNITGNQTGGTLSANYAISVTAAAAVTIAGTATASAAGIAVLISTAGASVVIDKIVGNGFGVGSAGPSLVPAVNNTVAATLRVREIEFGTLGACPVHGPVQFTPAVTNACQVYLAGGGTKTLLDSADTGTYPAASDVRYGVAFGSSSVGSAYIPEASSVAAGVPVGSGVGTALITAASLRDELAVELARIDAAISSRNATTPPTAAAVASQVRTELGTELARIDAAISSRNATTPPTAAAVASQVRTELGTELARIDAAISTRNATAPDNAGISAIKAKTDNLPSDPADQSLIIAATDAVMARLGAPAGASIAADIAGIESGGGGGGGGSGLSDETVAALEAAEQIFLAAPYTPTDAPVLVIPQPDPDEDLTVVYAYTENIINTKRAGISLTFKLVTTPARSERLLEVAAATVSTDANGYAQISLQSDLSYRVISRELGLDHIFTPTGETMDLLTLV